LRTSLLVKAGHSISVFVIGVGAFSG
jgi:hypothetical protein